MVRLEDYQNRFKYIRLRREDGVLEATIHRDGGSALWDFGADGIHGELGDAFEMIRQDRDNRVMILTGAGDVFLNAFDFGDGSGEPMGAAFWDRIYREGRSLLENLLAIEVPIISAVNGDAFIHSELPVLADIVLAAESARFADKAHFPNGTVPGDGVHVVWPMLLGPNRGRYFLLTGQEIDAQEALRIGFVAEVLPRAKLMDRAWTLARDIAAKPPMVVRYTKAALTLELRRRMASDLSHGLMLEGMAMLGPH
jgi:enoyl-CoA hydratase/carnithine racemase